MYVSLHFTVYIACSDRFFFNHKYEYSIYSGFGFSEMFIFQAEDGIRNLVRSSGLGDVYKRQPKKGVMQGRMTQA